MIKLVLTVKWVLAAIDCGQMCKKLPFGTANQMYAQETGHAPFIKK